MVNQTAILPLALLAALALGIPAGTYGLAHMGINGMMGYGWGIAEDVYTTTPMMGYEMVESHYDVEDHCPHHEYMEDYVAEHDYGQAQFVTVNGTVVGKDADYRLIVVDTGKGSMAIKLLKVYVNEKTGYMVSGDWLAEHIEEGDAVTIMAHGKIAYSIEWNSQSYTAP